MEWSINQYGIKTGCIHIPGLDLAGTYVTANGWIDERHMIVSAHKNLNTMECSLLLVDIEAGKTECVTKAAKWPCFCRERRRTVLSISKQNLSDGSKNEDSRIDF